MSNLRQILEANGIDYETSMSLLERINKGDGSQEENRRWSPADFDDTTVIDGRLGLQVRLDKTMRDRIAELLPGLDLKAFLLEHAPLGTLFSRGLEALGLELLPLASFCLLNGGAATSYVDEKRNRSAYPDYFPKVEDQFAQQASKLTGKPKALAPAYFNPDGSPGYSFLALKLRALQLQSRQYFAKSRLRGEFQKTLPYPLLPWLQMVNAQGRVFLDEALSDGQLQIPDAELERLLPETTRLMLHPLSAEQGLVAAFTPPDAQGQHQIFLNAFGKADSPLALPGGHGQIYRTMAAHFASLRTQGKRYVWIGNIDNLGFTPNLRSLALAALRQTDGLFEFSPKTAIDTKGGILVRNSHNHLTCADIGQAISPEEVSAFERGGSTILFNCATGLYDLDYLCARSDAIMANLPLRLSTNTKDAGTYVAAEQSTWEILASLERPVVLALDKTERFLASKFILDSFLTSGLAVDGNLDYRLRRLAGTLNHGLDRLLTKAYGLHLREGRYEAS